MGVASRFVCAAHEASEAFFVSVRRPYSIKEEFSGAGSQEHRAADFELWSMRSPVRTTQDVDGYVNI